MGLDDIIGQTHTFLFFIPDYGLVGLIAVNQRKSIDKDFQI